MSFPHEKLRVPRPQVPPPSSFILIVTVSGDLYLYTISGINRLLPGPLLALVQATTVSGPGVLSQGSTVLPSLKTPPRHAPHRHPTDL